LFSFIKNEPCHYRSACGYPRRPGSSPPRPQADKEVPSGVLLRTLGSLRHRVHAHRRGILRGWHLNRFQGSRDVFAQDVPSIGGERCLLQAPDGSFLLN